MEKITKALIDEINDITTYADLINLQKIIDVVITHDVRNSERLRAAVLESRKQINRIEIETKGKQSYRPLDFKRLKDIDYNPYVSAHVEIEEVEDVQEIKEETEQVEQKKVETRVRKAKK